MMNTITPPSFILLKHLFKQKYIENKERRKEGKDGGREEGRKGKNQTNKKVSIPIPTFGYGCVKM